MAGATLNCGLPTLINFGRFISAEATCRERRWNSARHSAPDRCRPRLLFGLRRPFLLVMAVEGKRERERERERERTILTSRRMRFFDRAS